MNRPDFSPLALALALLLGSAPVSAQQASSKVSSDIHVGAGQAAGALDTVSGDNEPGVAECVSDKCRGDTVSCESEPVDVVL